HVVKAFGERIVVLDGGPCAGGIESTVVDVTGKRAHVLRTGLIDAAMLEAAIGPLGAGGMDSARRSPGMMAKHYSPLTPLILASNETDARRIENEYDHRGAHAFYIREL